MIKVMFVCHGNICRSPMAEMILKEAARQRGVSGSLLIASSGVSSEEIIGGRGNPVYPPARAELKKRGIPCGEHRAVQLNRQDAERYDLFLGMDRGNLHSMRRILGEAAAQKIHLLMEYAGGGDVADPWYSGDFSRAFDDIAAGCAGLLDALTEQGMI